MSERSGWFADPSDPEDRDERWPWQAFIQTAGGCYPLPLWFETKEACERFIRDDVLGRGMLDDARRSGS